MLTCVTSDIIYEVLWLPMLLQTLLMNFCAYWCYFRHYLWTSVLTGVTSDIIYELFCCIRPFFASWQHKISCFASWQHKTSCFASWQHKISCFASWQYRTSRFASWQHKTSFFMSWQYNTCYIPGQLYLELHHCENLIFFISQFISWYEGEVQSPCIFPGYPQYKPHHIHCSRHKAAT
jgi:hypothetical protein